jgi:penicillin G amidase
MKWIKRVVWALLALLAALTGALGWYSQAVLPTTAGVVSLAGAQAEIQIERDVHGIPNIRASSLRDANFALGVVHAQDRLWQLETHRRIGAGRLAEIFGPSALEADRFLRALGVRRTAALQWQALPQASREALQAYADGVNAVIKTLRARPPEFVILGLQPEPWDPIDSLAWATMMAWDLGGNWTTELLRLRLALKLPAEQAVARINQLLPPYPGEAPLVTTDYAALFRGLKLDANGVAPATKTSLLSDWLHLLDIAPASGVEGVGSNNWVVAGSHSKTGKPLLANDPHLKLSTPALWYLARIEVAATGSSPTLKLAGATLPAVPGVVLGQNQHIAWGFTNTGPDVQDLYIEQIDPQDPTRYRTPEGWAKFESSTETIKVKGQADVVMQARSTRHGPVISDAGTTADVLGAPVPSGQVGSASGTSSSTVAGTASSTTSSANRAFALALRWTALDPQSDPVAPGALMQSATSVAQFFEATRGWVAPMQNMVVADREGHIGVISPGRVPLRKADNDLKGQVPAPGWDARYDWAGWVPADETPREVDPARGFIATANQRITPPNYPHYLTNDWALPYRQQRIEQLLQSKAQHSIEDLAALQADVKSLAAAKLLPSLRKAQSAHPLAAAAQAQLAQFDGTMAAEQAAPLIYWAWQRQLARGIFMDDAGTALWDRSLATRSFQDALEDVMQRADATWCDDTSTPAAETCDQQNNAAFTRALSELQAAQGADVAQWRWGRAHQARSEHRPFSRVPALARFFELRTPVGGDTQTVNVSRVGLKPDVTTGELYLDEHGPSLRALYDLGDPTQSRVMHSTGQSGIVFSPLYRSFVQPWAQVQYVPLWPVQGGTVKLLTVKPGG